jgi:hypothetical protein
MGAQRVQIKRGLNWLFPWICRAGKRDCFSAFHFKKGLSTLKGQYFDIKQVNLTVLGRKNLNFWLSCIKKCAIPTEPVSSFLKNPSFYSRQDGMSKKPS